jgi:predicted ferric reductase
MDEAMSKYGARLVILVCVAAAFLVVLAVSYTNTTTTLSLMCSSAAFAGMAMSQVLATRLKFVESMFGGLDRVYAFHKKLGVAIFFLILAHWYITPSFQGLAPSIEINKLSSQIGKLAFYILAVLISLSLIPRIPPTRIKIPYQIWRSIHRFIGLAFILAVIHLNGIKKPFDSSMRFLSLDSSVLLISYLNLCAVIGIVSYLYVELFARIKRRAYTVTDVVRAPGATIIEAKPIRKPLRIKPGQFVFLQVQKAGLRETHPFTVAVLNKDDSVTFAIKQLGDFTNKVRETIAPGDELSLEGGYGHFNYLRGLNRQIWLAGGIGITPFLAMANSVPASESRRIHLVYCVRTATEAIGLHIIESAVRRVDNFSCSLYLSSQKRLDADILATLVPFDIGGAELWFCGPAALRKSVEVGLKASGKALTRIEFERFQFR